MIPKLLIFVAFSTSNTTEKKKQSETAPLLYQYGLGHAFYEYIFCTFHMAGLIAEVLFIQISWPIGEYESHWLINSLKWLGHSPEENNY